MSDERTEIFDLKLALTQAQHALNKERDNTRQLRNQILLRDIKAAAKAANVVNDAAGDLIARMIVNEAVFNEDGSYSFEVAGKKMSPSERLSKIRETNKEFFAENFDPATARRMRLGPMKTADGPIDVRSLPDQESYFELRAKNPLACGRGDIAERRKSEIERKMGDNGDGKQQ